MYLVLLLVCIPLALYNGGKILLMLLGFNVGMVEDVPFWHPLVLVVSWGVLAVLYLITVIFGWWSILIIPPFTWFLSKVGD